MENITFREITNITFNKLSKYKPTRTETFADMGSPSEHFISLPKNIILHIEGYSDYICEDPIVLKYNGNKYDLTTRNGLENFAWTYVSKYDELEDDIGHLAYISTSPHKDNHSLSNVMVKNIEYYIAQNDDENDKDKTI